MRISSFSRRYANLSVSCRRVRNRPSFMRYWANRVRRYFSGMSSPCPGAQVSKSATRPTRSPRSREPPRHLEGDEASGGMAADVVRACGLESADLREIGLRHVLQALGNCPRIVQAARLQAVERLIRPEPRRQGAVRQERSRPPRGRSRTAAGCPAAESERATTTGRTIRARAGSRRAVPRSAPGRGSRARASCRSSSRSPRRDGRRGASARRGRRSRRRDRSARSEEPPPRSAPGAAPGRPAAARSPSRAGAAATRATAARGGRPFRSSSAAARRAARTRTAPCSPAGGRRRAGG